MSAGDSVHAVAWTLPYRDLWSLAAPRLGREPGLVFLDSGGAPDDQARWSVLAVRPRRVLTWPAGRPAALGGLRRFLARRAPPANDGLPLHGGWLGWFAYDLGRQLERLPSRARPQPAIPAFVLGEYPWVLIEDRRERCLFAAATVGPRGEGWRQLAEVREAVDAFLKEDSPLPASGEPACGPPRPMLPKDRYLAAVERILRYIEVGDLYQANFAHRFEAHGPRPAAPLYARLRACSPAAHGGYWDLPGAPQVLSVSPELFLRRQADRLASEPIKGTRPRGGGAADDAALLAELEASDKERAELLMIVDLVRNDLGRVAEIGSVAVPQVRRFSRHATVHHASARVTATVPAATGVPEILEAAFPGGSITGAPKIRAMEVLDELEPVRRGVYTGSGGWIGYDGDCCLNLLIRTIVLERHRAHYHVGGGIVADSDPAAEYEETLAKGAALERALRGEA